MRLRRSGLCLFSLLTFHGLAQPAVQRVALVESAGERADRYFDFLLYGRALAHEAGVGPAAQTAGARSGYLLSRLKRRHPDFDDPVIVTHLFSTGQYDEAVAQAEKCVKHHGDDWEAHLGSAHAYDALGKGEEAEREFNAAYQATDAAWARERVVYSRVVFFAQQKRFDAAINEIDQLLASSNVRSKHAPFYLLKGTICLQKSIPDFKNALVAFDEALHLNPLMERALKLKALIFEQTGRKAELAQTLTRLVALNPQPALAKRLVAVLFELKQWGDAYEHLEPLREQTPDYFYDLALISFRMQEHDRALLHVDQALSCDAAFARARLLKLEILSSIGKQHEALMQFRQWLPVDKQRKAFPTLAALAGKAFSYDEVITMLKPLQKQKVIAQEVQSLLGDLYLASGKYRLAQGHYQTFAKNLKKRPEDRAHAVKALYNLAYTLRKQGYTERALYQLESAHKIDPNNIQIVAMMAHLHAHARYKSKRRCQTIEKLLAHVRGAGIKSPVVIPDGDPIQVAASIDYIPSPFWLPCKSRSLGEQYSQLCRKENEKIEDKGTQPVARHAQISPARLREDKGESA